VSVDSHCCWALSLVCAAAAGTLLLPRGEGDGSRMGESRLAIRLRCARGAEYDRPWVRDVVLGTINPPRRARLGEKRIGAARLPMCPWRSRTQEQRRSFLQFLANFRLRRASAKSQRAELSSCDGLSHPTQSYRQFVGSAQVRPFGIVSGNPCGALESRDNRLSLNSSRRGCVVCKSNSRVCFFLPCSVPAGGGRWLGLAADRRGC
jgi:hypothetical protein